MNKVGLSAYDTKRWVQEDGIHTYAYGHYRTSEVVHPDEVDIEEVVRELGL